MTNYKPDWNSIPKEFKYCYYYQDPMTDPEAQAVLCKNRIPYFDGRNMHRIERPPELVDGAWYAVTLDDAVSSKLVVKWTESDGTFSLIGVAGMAYSLGRISIIHNRIPDELWNG